MLVLVLVLAPRLFVELLVVKGDENMLARLQHHRRGVCVIYSAAAFSTPTHSKCVYCTFPARYRVVAGHALFVWTCDNRWHGRRRLELATQAGASWSRREPGGV